MRIEIEEDSVKFKHDGGDYEVTGTAIHNTESVDVGIGPYEFWGTRGFDRKIVEGSDFFDCEFEDLSIRFFGESEDIPEPSKELVDAAEEALYEATKDRAEDRATEMAD